MPELKLPKIREKGLQIFESDTLLIHPGFDASEREVYARNGYVNANKKIEECLTSG